MTVMSNSHHIINNDSAICMTAPLPCVLRIYGGFFFTAELDLAQASHVLYKAISRLSSGFGYCCGVNCGPIRISVQSNIITSIFMFTVQSRYN